MPSRFARTVLSCLAVGLLHADVASAQQSLNFSVGYFTVRGEDARVDGDVLVENRDVYLFDFSDFNTGSFGAEWVAPLGDFLEVGAGIEFTSRGVDTIYQDFTRPGDIEIICVSRERKLRVIVECASRKTAGRNRNDRGSVILGIRNQPYLALHCANRTERCER